MINGYKPQLLPNNKVGVDPDWQERIQDPEQWLYSAKADGARIALLSDGRIVGRSLKALPSVHVNRMGREVAALMEMGAQHIIEGEFYAHDMTFSEIMHFFKTEDVESKKSVDKYKKLWDKSDGGTNLDIWKYPGRDWQWLTTWHDELQFHLFDIAPTNNPHACKWKRVKGLDAYVDKYFEALARAGQTHSHIDVLVHQQLQSIDHMMQEYDRALDDGYEGLVVVHRNSPYKYGRHTLNAKQIFKLKEDKLQWDGVVIDVLESTIAREGAPKTVNELGRSVTSKLKEDRIPSGMAKGFLVRLPDGQTMTVSLKGYDHPDRIKLLENKQEAIGQHIRFTGMAPVKEGGCPRHAHYERGNVTESKTPA